MYYTHTNTTPTTMQSSQTTPSTKYIKSAQWDTSANRYMQPRSTDRGLKSIAIISTQKNKKLHIQLPSMTCWGITDYTDTLTGESDGKFSIKLHFSGKENYQSEESQNTLEKLKEFEQQILRDAVTNSEAWFGKKQSREIVEFSYFPFLKPGKNAETKQPDPVKGTYFRPKVNIYNGKWDVEIFDLEGTPMFPSEVESETPIDFVPSGSEVTCGIECKQIWIGAKGWGLSWALKQCVVIPKKTENSTGKLQLDISDDDKQVMYNAPPAEKPEDVDEKEEVDEKKKETDTYAPDSDGEEAEVQVEVPVPAPAPAPVKQVVKKAEVSAEQAVVAEEAQPAAKKKVVARKKA